MSQQHYSKYRAKIIARRNETESGRIAQAIMDLESGGHIEDIRKRHELSTNGGKLFDEYSIHGSKDAFIWVISKPVEYKANRYWEKIVQSNMASWDAYVQMLDAQPWNYI